jgi:hypothetical protein
MSAKNAYTLEFQPAIYNNLCFVCIKIINKMFVDAGFRGSFSIK